MWRSHCRDLNVHEAMRTDRVAMATFLFCVCWLWIVWMCSSENTVVYSHVHGGQHSQAGDNRHKAGKSGRPNIIFILADDLGWNDVGFHGSVVRTPVLDSLARSGVILDNYYVQPICSPSRGQLMSGRYQIHTGLQHGIFWPPQPSGLPLEETTLAELMQKAGYATHMVGKWHLGFYKEEYLPNKRGFDSFYGLLTGQSGHYNHTHCWTYQQDGVERCGLDLHKNRDPVRNQNGTYSTELYASEAKRLIKNHEEQKEDKPFFLYLAFQNPHTPQDAPKKYTDRYAYIQDSDRRVHAAMVTALDDAVGEVVSTLQNTSLWENTVLIFSSDNGGQVMTGGSNYPLRGWKGSYWEGGIRGVGFVNSPLLGTGGATRHQLMHISDWLPTLVTLAGGNLHGLQLDGYDVWSAIRDNIKIGPRTEVLHNIDPLSGPFGKPREGAPFDIRVQAAIRSGPWKLLTGNPGCDGLAVAPPELPPYGTSWSERLKEEQNLYKENVGTKNLWLFNIDNDPHESTDVAADNPDVVDFLLQRLSVYNASAVPVIYPDFYLESDPSLNGGVWGPWR